MNTFLSWLSKVYSDDQSASFGRCISTAAFIFMLGLHIIILINPWKIITNFDYVNKLTDHLFKLTVGGYSVSSIKEITHVIFSKLPDKSDDTNG